MDYYQRAVNVMNGIEALAAISEDKTGITRTYGSSAFIKGRNLVEEWMKEAGLQTNIDQIGNLRAALPAKNKNSKKFIIASHIDTVVNAGKFDGPLGVFIGINILQSLYLSNTALPFDIELIAFCDEEGVRFHSTYLGSKAVAGIFEETLFMRKDENGISLQQAIKNIGGNTDKIKEDALPRENLLGYLEIHIEQGPVLYEKKIPVGVVTAIAGQQRFEMIFKGIAGHAGTVPMKMRADSLCAAAECILAIEQYGIASEDNIVATVGKLNITHPASNVIPGHVSCSLDIRSSDENRLSTDCAEIELKCIKICRERNIDFEFNFIQSSSPVICSKKLSDLICEAIKKQNIESQKLVSGAGHDAVPISAICDVSMLFVRCYKGISHNPLEDVALQDIAVAIETSEKFLGLLAEEELLGDK